MNYTTWRNNFQYSATDDGSEDCSVALLTESGKGISFLSIMPVGDDTHTPTRPTPGPTEECGSARPLPQFLHATLPGPRPTPPWLRALCSNTTRLSTYTHREGISYMTQMRTQTRGETLCDLVCGWLMDKTDVCLCLWRDAGRPGALCWPPEHTPGHSHAPTAVIGPGPSAGPDFSPDVMKLHKLCIVLFLLTTLLFLTIIFFSLFAFYILCGNSNFS